MASNQSFEGLLENLVWTGILPSACLNSTWGQYCLRFVATIAIYKNKNTSRICDTLLPNLDRFTQIYVKIGDVTFKNDLGVRGASFCRFQPDPRFPAFPTIYRSKKFGIENTNLNTMARIEDVTVGTSCPCFNLSRVLKTEESDSLTRGFAQQFTWDLTNMFKRTVLRGFRYMSRTSKNWNPVYEWVWN